MGLFSAILGVGASLYGASQEASAAKKAAKLQYKTAQENREFAKEQIGAGLGDFDQALTSALGEYNALGDTASAFDPYREAGTNALSQLQALLGLSGGAETALSTLQNLPGYQFRLQQGAEALDRAQNAAGQRYSGNTLTALNRYGQDYATSELDRQVARLGGLVDTGGQATTNATNVLGTAITGRANALLGTGQNKAGLRAAGIGPVNAANTAGAQAQTAGVVGPANAWNTGMTNALSFIKDYESQIASGLGGNVFGGGSVVPASYNPNALYGTY